MGKNTCHVNMRARVRIPSTHAKTGCCSLRVCNPSIFAGREEEEMGESQKQACRSASLLYAVEKQLRDPVSK